MESHTSREKRRRLLNRSKTALFIVGLLFLGRPAAADDIRVMTSGAFTAAYLELRPQFERGATDKVVTVTTTMGTGAESIPSRLERGEAVDVVIMNDESLQQL